MFGSLFNAAIDVVTSPIEIAKDAVTLGGLVTGEDESYTEKRLRKLKQDGEEILDDLD